MDNISPEKVCFLIMKARQFDAKVLPSDPDPGSNDADDGFVDVLEDSPDDPVAAELVSFIHDLNDDELTELIALVMVGRGDFDRDAWADAIAAAEEDADRRRPRWFLQIPLLGDFLEEGLAAFGQSCEEFEAGHL